VFWSKVGAVRNLAMNVMYAMQRANGDWFAFDDHGRLRVPVFRSSWDAMSARMSHPGMLLFKPVALNEHALREMAAGEANSVVYFWLVDNPSINVNRGHLIEHTELARIVRDASAQTLVDSEG
jgi:hypothetical protein